MLAKNIDCGYSLEPQSSFRAKMRKNVFPYKLQFNYIKVVLKGVYITRTCLHGAGIIIFCHVNYIACSRLSRIVRNLQCRTQGILRGTCPRPPPPPPRRGRECPKNNLSCTAESKVRGQRQSCDPGLQMM